MERFKGEKIIYGVMILLICIQYFIPVVSLAEPSDAAKSTISITSAELKERTLELSANVENQKNEVITKEITFSEGLILEAQPEQSGQGTAQVTYTTEPTKLTLKLAAGVQGTVTITAKLAQASITNQSLQVYSGEQALTINNATATTQASSNADSSTTATEQTEASETKSAAPQTKPTAKALVTTDIRTYFPDGSGTILTNTATTYTDDNGNQITSPIAVDATVNLHYDWSIPEEIRNQIQPGDYFTFNLPDGVVVSSAQSGSLKDPNGEEYATYTLDNNGKVTITFNENVTQEFDITGTFNFETTFDLQHIDGPGVHQITFPTEDNLPPISVTIRPATNTSITKTGHFDRTPNPSAVEWTVDFNQGMFALSNPKITEHWPSGLTYRSLTVYKIVMNLDGTIKGVGEQLSSNQYTVDANGNVQILGDTMDAYRIIYESTINESVIPPSGGKVSLTNRATLSDDHNPDGIDAKNTVASQYGKTLDKSRTSYSPTTQVFSWAIKYNYGEKKISQANAVITDTLSSNMDLVDGSIHIYAITFSASGTEQKGAELATPADYTLAPNPNDSGFVIKFTHDISTAYRVEYKSKMNGEVTDTTAVQNDVAVGTGETAKATSTAQQENINKTLQTVDYDKGTLAWEMKVNANHYSMSDLVINDTYSPVPGINLSKDNNSNYLLTVKTSSGRTLVYGTDYTIETTHDSDQNETGFVIKFLAPNYNPTTQAFTINYQTDFDITLIDPRDPALDHFTNIAKAQWKDQTNTAKQSTDSDTFRPNPAYSLNAEKSGAYNAQTKEITWTSAINLSRHVLTDAYFQDVLKDNQQYVKGSLNIYQARTAADGSVTKIDNVPDNNTMTSIQEPTTANDNTIVVHFPNQSQYTYIIEFKTTLVGSVITESKSYENVAQYSNGGVNRDVIGEVTVKNGGSHLQKSGQLDPQHPDYVFWNLLINPAQSTLSNVVVNDTPSNNQIVDKNSIQIYETTVNENGDITPDKNRPLIQGVDYTAEVLTNNVTGVQTMTITFLHDISSTYSMEYRSLVNSSATGKTDTVSNKATITGDGTKTITDNSGTNVSVPVNTTGGAATGKKGSITLQKTKEDEASILTGAHFELWNTTKTQILREGDVDSTGKITFGNLQLGEYLLFETNAPAGYTIPDSLVNGRRIKITAETSNAQAAPLKIVNTPNKVILTKIGENEKTLAGAGFKLERLEGDLWLPVNVGNLVTDNQGKLEIDSLLLGHYRLTEIQAPSGYLLNITPIEFDVMKNTEYQVPTVELSMIDYQGRASLVKNNEAGEPLADAVFKVIDETGTTVQDNLVSDATGAVSVNGLAPGEYRFVETKAPAGYLVNTQELPFTIENAAAGQPSIVAAGEVVDYQGIAQLQKTDQAGNPLAGAVFKVVDQNGQTVQSQLTSDATGTVAVTGLAPGEYQFIETSAPTGFILNSEAVPFAIEDSADGKPAVVDTGSLKNYQGSAQIRKVDTSGQPLSGATFSLLDENHQSLNKTVTTGGDGVAFFDKLSPGTYYLKETKAPKLPDGSNYVINPYEIAVTIAPTAQGPVATIDLGDFQNFKGKALITKKGNGRELANTVFAMYLFDENTGGENKIGEVISDENGNVPIDNLGSGAYKLVETRPAPGFIINTQPIYFIVDPELNAKPVDELIFTNYQVSVEATKVDGDKLDNNQASENLQALSGAEFQVFKQNQDGSRGDQVTVYDQSGAEMNTVTSDQDGKVMVTGLESGTYLLVETKAPAGYVVNQQAIPFEVTPELGEPKPIDLGEINNYRGKLDVSKTDALGKPLSGGSFILTKDPQKPVPLTVLDENGKETKELFSVEGHIKAQGLAPGDYYLIETKAPNGYLINNKPVKLTIAASADQQTGLTAVDQLINYQGSAVLTKVNELKEPLAGAVFKVIDAAGTEIKAELTSDPQGKVTIENLAPGSYTIIETKSPSGYQLSEQFRAFTIDQEANGKPESLMLGTFENKQIPNKNKPINQPGNPHEGDYPKMNEQLNKIAAWGGLIFLVAVGSYFIWQRKRMR